MTDGADRLPPWARITAARLEHIRRVAALIGEWGAAMDPAPDELDRWLRAAWLHDAVKDAPADLLRDLTPAFDGPDPLRHGPAAAELAARHGETDTGVLSAVRYHSVGSADWDRAGQILYLADFLEPGRRHQPPERDAWVAHVPEAPDEVLRGVAAARIGYTLRRGWPLLPETVAFWNALHP